MGPETIFFWIKRKYTTFYSINCPAVKIETKGEMLGNWVVCYSLFHKDKRFITNGYANEKCWLPVKK